MLPRSEVDHVKRSWTREVWRLRGRRSRAQPEADRNADTRLGGPSGLDRRTSGHENPGLQGSSGPPRISGAPGTGGILLWRTQSGTPF
jgi:hypothetical protein